MIQEIHAHCTKKTGTGCTRGKRVFFSEQESDLVMILE